MKVMLLLLLLMEVQMMMLLLLIVAVIHLVVHPLFTALALDETGRGKNRR